ncbi:fructosamine kinase family protein [Chitinophaga pinensis]|uniref:Fructosamine kinase family protein n=1 Tax=Chitinophaga pinensis TaxID=79329 RepID=A0A5C6LJP6_9BACT|nr:fructosamine kinase family protein [Chitinophaga pinensis]TWV92214.1 fructosamine kinase family protein [Chitinophaga pinensis]
MDKHFLHHLSSILTTHWHTPVDIHNYSAVSGGDINEAAIIETSRGPWFLKRNHSSYAMMFEKEFNALNLLKSTNTLKVPAPLLYGSYQQYTYLLMEYLPKGHAGPQSVYWLAEGLAALHKTTHEQFGLGEDNYIGTIVQQNTWKSSWAAFYAENRILPLVRQLVDMRHFGTKEIRWADALAVRLAELFPLESPALLHGDLWAGNYMFMGNGDPVIYDPAVYYGHREMDIAMTLLFGGFEAAFYQRYQEIFPLAADWRQRVLLCQLYPLLVHAILFGGHYVGQSADILAQYA